MSVKAMRTALRSVFLVAMMAAVIRADEDDHDHSVEHSDHHEHGESDEHMEVRFVSGSACSRPHSRLRATRGTPHVPCPCVCVCVCVCVCACVCVLVAVMWGVTGGL